jgi:hypothetical protein
MRTSFFKSRQSRLVVFFFAGFLFPAPLKDCFSSGLLQGSVHGSFQATGQTKTELSRTGFEMIEGKFHDGLGTFAEIHLANEIIKAAKLPQAMFDASGSEAKMREAIASLPESHKSRAIFQQEIVNIKIAAKEGALALLGRIKPATLAGVRHTAREYAGAKAGDLCLAFKDRADFPVSVKTDKANKVAISEGQTPHLGEKWATRYFKVSEDELDKMIAGLNFTTRAELKSNYLNVARLVAEVLIRKLKLEECLPTDFSKARVTDLEAMKFLLRQLRLYKSGEDRSCVIIFKRSTGAVLWESLLDSLDIDNLTADRISFLPSRPRNNRFVATEFGIKIDHRTVVTFQVKHRRGRARGTNRQFEFSDITTRLKL